MKLLPFSPFPEFAASISAQAALTVLTDGLRLEYQISGTGVETLALAPLAEHPARRDELWKHTCVEAFLAVADSPRYYEFNGSPSGDWSLYRFDDYREGMKAQPVTHVPRLLQREWQRDSLRLVWELPFFCDEKFGCAGITAVLQDIRFPGVSSYWALHHGGAQADFHRRDSFLIKDF